MRGSLWSTLVVAVGAALFMGAAWTAAKPSTTAGSTEGVVSILSVTTAFSGQFLLLVGLGTFAALYMGRHAFGGGL